MGSDTKPVQCVFFFTDGSAGTSGIDKIFKSLRGFPRFRLIRLFTLGFGSGCNYNDLKVVTKAGNNGQLEEEFDNGPSIQYC